MKVTQGAIPGVLVIEPAVHRDARGYFLESYHAERYAAAGVPGPFVQDNVTLSRRGTLRGLHAQPRRPQGKLCAVLSGEVFDVSVDLRPGSPTFGRWFATILSEANHRQIYLPPGFAHGFCVLSERARFVYKCTATYDARGEIAIRWDDPDLAIEWPIVAPLLSGRDAAALPLTEAMRLLERAPGSA